MRVGLALPHYDFSLPGAGVVAFDAVAEVAVRADRLGFDSVWMSDHFFARLDRYGGGPERYGTLEPIVTLAALAPLTERVRLGTLVLAAGFRHPAILAKSATAIDRLSDGRFEIGLGAGWFGEEFEAFGLPFGDPGERFEVLEETLGYLDALFGPAPASFRGDRFSLTDAYNHPPPIGDPRPPILVGGKGGPRLLRLAARFADGWNAAWRWTPGAYAERAAAAREACERVERDPATLRLSLGLYTVLGEDEADVARRWETIRTTLPSGVADAVGLEALRAEGLAGTPEHVLERLATFAELGVAEAIVCPAPIWFAMPDPSMVDLFAEAVLPAAREL
jgi:probable F420-dependent oxidoreductase